jgi:hypothetical protein
VILAMELLDAAGCCRPYMLAVDWLALQIFLVDNELGLKIDRVHCSVGGAAAHQGTAMASYVSRQQSAYIASAARCPHARVARDEMDCCLQAGCVS